MCGPLSNQQFIWRWKQSLEAQISPKVSLEPFVSLFLGYYCMKSMFSHCKVCQILGLYTPLPVAELSLEFHLI